MEGGALPGSCPQLGCALPGALRPPLGGPAAAEWIEAPEARLHLVSLSSHVAEAQGPGLQQVPCWEALAEPACLEAEDQPASQLFPAAREHRDHTRPPASGFPPVETPFMAVVKVQKIMGEKTPAIP